MMRFDLQPEPATFDVRCRQRGKKWLADHPDYDRPHDYWSEFGQDLRQAFRGLCAYCAMWVMNGQTDHFVPVAMLKQQKQDLLAYEWDNYRYADGSLNGRKSKHIVLDPFTVNDEWFEISLPSLQLLLTDKLPAEKREIAEFTVKQLGLQDGEVVVRCRREWFKLYQERKLTLEGLKDRAPLIARAVENDLKNGKDWRQPEQQGT